VKPEWLCRRSVAGSRSAFVEERRRRDIATVANVGVTGHAIALPARVRRGPCEAALAGVAA